MDTRPNAFPKDALVKAIRPGSQLCEVFCILTATLLLAGCGSIVTSQQSSLDPNPSSEPSELKEAVVYYLPRGVIKVDGSWEDKKGWTVIISTDIHADRSQRYILTLKTNYPFFDHNGTFVVNEKGLLKTVTGAATDHTVDSAVSLIAAAGSALSFGAALGMPIAAERALGVDYTPFHVTLDPFSGKTSANVANFTISVDEAMTVPKADNGGKESFSKRDYQGVAARLLIPFTVTVTPNNSDENHVQTATIVLPDIRQTYVLSVPRAPLVTNETTIQLLDGSLVSRDVKRPSVLYGFINIPKNILAALVPIPGSARQQQVANIEATKTILSDEAAIKKLRENP
jgi:hypothetical protein